MTEKVLKPKPLPPAHMPSSWEPADVSALQAINDGTATADQQRRGLMFIITKLSMAYDFPFRPGGLDAQRETDIALGRAFVGQQIIGLIKVNLSAMLQPSATEPKTKT